MQTSQQKGNSVTVDWRPHSKIIQTLGAPPACDVSTDAIATFQRDGVVLLRGAFADWVDRLRAGLQRNMNDPDNYAFPCDSVAPGGKGRFLTVTATGIAFQNTRNLSVHRLPHQWPASL